MIRKGRVLDDIFTPGTPGDFEQTLSAMPIPPTDFSVSKAGTVPDQAKFSIGDRHYVPKRNPNLAYQVFFTPILVSGATDLSNPLTRQGIIQAGQIVTQVAGQGNGNTLTAFDSQFQGKKGYFSCVAINVLTQRNVCVHVCPSPWN